MASASVMPTKRRIARSRGTPPARLQALPDGQPDHAALQRAEVRLDEEQRELRR